MTNQFIVNLSSKQFQIIYIHRRLFFAAFLLFALFALIFTNPALANETACERHLHLHGSLNSEKLLNNEISEFQKLIEESLVYRTESINVAKSVKAKISRNIPLSGADLKILNEGLLAHLALRKKLYHFAELHECWLDLSRKAAKENSISTEHRLQGVMLSLSAALTLYDNYLLAISIYEEDTKLRRFLNSQDAGYTKGYAELAAVTLSYNSINNRARVRKAIHVYESGRKSLVSKHNFDHFQYLDLFISQSPSYQLTREFAPFRVFRNKVKFLDAITGDTISALRKEGINMFSMVFGNTVGLIESRKGKLYNNPEMTKRVRSSLKAGDILLEKTPFRLTDKFIPGHWGHAAIWIGNENELKSLGIWKHPLVQRYRQQIRQGNLVVEALRNGVVMSSLEEFMNIDDLGVMRVSNNSKQQKVNIILLALRQVGKAYDFNFDVESTDKIVCSELIYVSVTSIDWPTANTLGRYTISPDNIAAKSLKNGPIKLVMLIHDGKVVERKAQVMMARLLQDVSNNGR